MSMKKIFKALNWIMGIIFLLSAGSVDEPSWFQVGVCAVSGAYIVCALYISEALKKRRK